MNKLEAGAVEDFLSGHDRLTQRADKGLRDERSGPYARLFDRGFIAPVPSTLTDDSVRWSCIDTAAQYRMARLLWECGGASGLVYRWLYSNAKASSYDVTPVILVMVLNWVYDTTEVAGLRIELSQADGSLQVSETATDGTVLSQWTAKDEEPDSQESLFEPLLEKLGYGRPSRTLFHPERLVSTAGLSGLREDLLSWVAWQLYDASCEELVDVDGSTLATEGDSDDDDDVYVRYGVGDLFVDLVNWRAVPLARFSESSVSPSAFTDSLPVAVQQALRFLEAPPFASSGEFLEWAETSLTVTYSCCGTNDFSKISPMTLKPRIVGAKRHTVRIDPHTGASHQVAKNAKALAEVEGEHFLWTLKYTREPYQCQRVEHALTLLGDSPDHLSPEGDEWAKRPAERLLSIRTVVRVVEYLDRGLDVVEAGGWIELGAPVGLRDLARKIDAAGIATEDAVLDALVGNTRYLGQAFHVEVAVPALEKVLQAGVWPERQNWAPFRRKRRV